MQEIFTTASLPSPSTAAAAAEEEEAQGDEGANEADRQTYHARYFSLRSHQRSGAAAIAAAARLLNATVASVPLLLRRKEQAWRNAAFRCWRAYTTAERRRKRAVRKGLRRAEEMTVDTHSYSSSSSPSTAAATKSHLSATSIFLLWRLWARCSRSERVFSAETAAMAALTEKVEGREREKWARNSELAEEIEAGMEKLKRAAAAPAKLKIASSSLTVATAEKLLADIERQLSQLEAAVKTNAAGTVCAFVVSEKWRRKRREGEEAERQEEERRRKRKEEESVIFGQRAAAKTTTATATTAAASAAAAEAAEASHWNPFITTSSLLSSYSSLAGEGWGAYTHLSTLLAEQVRREEKIERRCADEVRGMSEEQLVIAWTETIMEQTVNGDDTQQQTTAAVTGETNQPQPQQQQQQQRQQQQRFRLKDLSSLRDSRMYAQLLSRLAPEMRNSVSKIETVVSVLRERCSCSMCMLMQMLTFFSVSSRRCCLFCRSRSLSLPLFLSQTDASIRAKLILSICSMIGVGSSPPTAVPTAAAAASNAVPVSLQLYLTGAADVHLLLLARLLLCRHGLPTEPTKAHVKKMREVSACVRM